VLGLHVVGLFLLLVLVVPQDFRLGQGAVFGLGLGITAYTLGLRHAFDADHICVIDNTTRKLMADGQRPLSVGFFFSLGHSTIVFLLAFLFSVGVRGLSGSVESGSSTLHKATGVIGASVSGSFLFLIGILNLLILVNIVKVFRRMRVCDYDEQALEHELNARGFMNRFYGRATRAVKKPWQMYPLGVLFGLGFDTATEVALLFLAAGAAGAGLPFYAILCLPSLRRRHVSARHDRRRVHELRLRLGVLQTGAQDLLQHHHHRAVGRRRADRRHDRAALRAG
jgi:nickel/cobalt transporter (NiCoT) family protein